MIYYVINYDINIFILKITSIKIIINEKIILVDKKKIFCYF